MSLSFYHSQATVLSGKILAVRVLSQHQVLSLKTIRPHVPCGAQCMGYTVVYHLFSSLPLQFNKNFRQNFVTCNSAKEQLYLCMDEWNCSTLVSSQAIELNPSCLRQAHSNSLGTGHGYKSKKPECILTVLCIPSIICPLRSADA